MDVRLGDGTGHDITKWIKSHCPNVNVVLLTSFLEDDVLIQGYTSKASASVLKGPPTSELVKAIRDVASGMELINPVEVRAASKRVNAIPSNVLSTLSQTVRENALIE